MRRRSAERLWLRNVCLFQHLYRREPGRSLIVTKVNQYYQTHTERLNTVPGAKIGNDIFGTYEGHLSVVVFAGSHEDDDVLFEMCVKQLK